LLAGIYWTVIVTVCAFVLVAALGLPICAMNVSRSRPLHAVTVVLIVILLTRDSFIPHTPSWLSGARR